MLLFGLNNFGDSCVLKFRKRRPENYRHNACEENGYLSNLKKGKEMESIMIGIVALQIGLFILFVVLAIVFITSHRRLAIAHEEVAMQLSHIAKNLNKH